MADHRDYMVENHKPVFLQLPGADCSSVHFLLTTPGHTHFTFQDDYREKGPLTLPPPSTWMQKASWTLLAACGQSVLASVIY